MAKSFRLPGFPGCQWQYRGSGQGSEGKLVHPAPLKGQHWMIPSPGESSGVDEYMVYFTKLGRWIHGILPNKYSQYKTRPFGRYLFYPTSWYYGIGVDIPWAGFFQCCFRKAKLHPSQEAEEDLHLRLMEEEAKPWDEECLATRHGSCTLCNLWTSGEQKAYSENQGVYNVCFHTVAVLAYDACVLSVVPLNGIPLFSVMSLLMCVPFIFLLAVLAILAVDCVMFCPFDRLVFSPLRFCCSASTGLSEGEDAKELGILGVNLSEQYVATICHYILPILPICCGCCLEHPWTFLTQGHW